MKKKKKKMFDFNFVSIDNWILLTFENGDQYQNVCSNALRTASVMLMCGTKQVRNENKRETLRKRKKKDRMSLIKSKKLNVSCSRLI